MKLLDHHLTHLKFESGLEEETIRKAGIISIETESQAENILGMRKVPVPGIYFPYTQGQNVGRYRPDKPLVTDNGDKLKYLAPKDKPFLIYQVDKLLKGQPIWIVEGEKKALCVRQAGLNACGIGGAFMWHDKAYADINKDDNKILHHELREAIEVGTEVTVLFDNDIDTNNQILFAAGQFIKALIDHGAKARICFLPHISNPKVKGADDFFVHKKVSGFEYCKWLEEQTYYVYAQEQWLEQIRIQTQNKAQHENATVLQRFAKLAWVIYGKEEAPTVIKRAAKKFGLSKGLLEGYVTAFKKDIGLFKNKSKLKLTLNNETLLHVRDTYLKKLQDSDADLAFNNGKFYQYNKSAAIWEMISDEAVRVGFEQIDGALIDNNFFYLTKKFIDELYSATRDKLLVNAQKLSTAGSIRFNNGTFVIDKDRNPKLVPHDKELGTLVSFNTDYKTKVKTPQIDAAFDRVFETDADKEDKIKCIKEFVGLCLLGRGTFVQTALIFADGTPDASGANGKSTLLALIKKAFKMRSSASPTEWGVEHIKAMLANSQINLVDELPEGDLLHSDAFKAIITGEVELTAREKFGRAFVFSPRAGHIFACNKLPRPKDMSGAFWRRVVIIKFNQNFSANPNRHISEQLEKELPEFVVDCVNHGARVLREQKFTIPESAEKAKTEWKEDTNHLNEFVECCLTKDRDLANQEYLMTKRWRASDILVMYNEWCRIHNYRKKGGATFYKGLTKLIGESIHTKQGNQYEIYLKDEGLKYLLAGGFVRGLT